MGRTHSNLPTFEDWRFCTLIKGALLKMDTEPKINCNEMCYYDADTGAFLMLVTMLKVQVILKIRYHLSGSGLLNTVDCPMVKPDQIFLMNYINELKFFFTRDKTNY